MMDATQAQKQTRAALRKARKHEQAESRRAQARQRKAVRAALKTVPDYIARVEREIRQVANNGKNSHAISHKESPEQDAKDDKLIAHLEAKKFKVAIRREYSPGEWDNMGDFNAPCNVWRDACWYRHILITW